MSHELQMHMPYHPYFYVTQITLVNSSGHACKLVLTSAWVFLQHTATCCACLTSNMLRSMLHQDTATCCACLATNTCALQHAAHVCTRHRSVAYTQHELIHVNESRTHVFTHMHMYMSSQCDIRSMLQCACRCGKTSANNSNCLSCVGARNCADMRNMPTVLANNSKCQVACYRCQLTLRIVCLASAQDIAPT